MGDDFLIKTSPNRHMQIKFFNRKFGTSRVYDELINHENVDGKWKERFEWMKEQGILN